MRTGRPRFNVELLVERGIFPENWKEVIYERARTGGNKLHFANLLNISRKSLYRLMDRSDDFRLTIEKALQISEEWFVQKALDRWGEDGAKGLNATFFKYYAQNVYRDSEWVDRTDITTDGKPITPDNNIQIEIIKSKEEEDEDNSQE